MSEATTNIGNQTKGNEVHIHLCLPISPTLPKITDFKARLRKYDIGLDCDNLTQVISFLDVIINSISNTPYSKYENQAITRNESYKYSI